MGVRGLISRFAASAARRRQQPHFPVKAVFTTTFSGPSHSRHSCTKAGWFRHLAPNSLPLSASRIFSGVSPSNMVITSLICWNAGLSMPGTRR